MGKRHMDTGESRDKENIKKNRQRNSNSKEYARSYGIRSSIKPESRWKAKSKTDIGIPENVDEQAENAHQLSSVPI